MSWEALGAIGDLVGGVAVVVTLAYLALQVRHARVEMRRAIYVQRQEAARELSLARASNLTLLEDIAAADHAFGRAPAPFVKHMSERAGLTAAAAFRLMWDEYAWWYFRAQQIPFLLDLPQGERIAFERGIRFNYRERPLGAFWYDTQKSQLSPDLVEYVDDVLARES
jgi:hypothetical protein